jgi:hypothetical protein
VLEHATAESNILGVVKLARKVKIFKSPAAE